MELKKKSLFLLFLVGTTACFGFIGYASACRGEEYKTNYAEWRFTNDQYYLYVEADNYYTLGYLEGQNLAFQTAWMKLMIMLQAQELGLSYDTAIYYALGYYEFFSEDYLLEMQGMADGIDFVLIPFMGSDYNITIDFYDVLVQNCFWDIYYGQIIPIFSGYPQPPLIAGGCTAIGAHIGRKTVFGQHIDLTYLMAPTTSWVYTKINGKKVFSFRMGSMLAMGGVNKWGVAISENLLEIINVGCVGKPLSVIYRSALETAKSVWHAKRIILSNDFTLGWNYIIKGRRQIAAIETIPNTFSLERVGRNSYTFDANIYEDPLFQMFMIYPTKYVPRYTRVSELCQKYTQDQRLDLNDLFNIFSDPLISRRFTTGEPMEVGTVASFFVDTRNNVYFCLGNSADSKLGVLTRFD